MLDWSTACHARSDVDKDTMSATMKPAKEFHELDVGQPNVECQLMVLHSRRQLVARRGELRPVHVLTLMVSPMMSSRDKLWRATLSCLSQPVEKAGYMVKSMRLIPTNKIGQACGKVRLLRLPREVCFDQGDDKADKAEKDTVTLNGEHGKVTTVEEGLDVERPVVGGVWRAERRCQ